MEKAALIVVDLVNDFVTGVFGSDVAINTVAETAKVLEKAGDSIEVIFTQDSHIEDDPEFKVWGVHCIDGTEGSKLCPELASFRGYHLKKRHFDSFQGSDLDGLLRAMAIRKLYVCGISTDICVLHTVAGAFFRYYDITVVKDLCSAIDPGRHEKALDDMKANYGARLIGSGDFIKEII